MSNSSNRSLADSIISVSSPNAMSARLPSHRPASPEQIELPGTPALTAMSPKPLHRDSNGHFPRQTPNGAHRKKKSVHFVEEDTAPRVNIQQTTKVTLGRKSKVTPQRAETPQPTVNSDPVRVLRDNEVLHMDEEIPIEKFISALSKGNYAGGLCFCVDSLCDCK